MSPYRTLGVALLAVGALCIAAFVLVFPVVPLAAIGLSATIVGCTSVFLAGSRPRLSPEACAILMQAGMDNVTAMLERLGIQGKAVYYPGSMNGGQPHAAIPVGLQERPGGAAEGLLGKLLDTGGAIEVATPGGISLGLLRSRPGPAEEDIRSAIAYLVVGALDIGKAVKVSMRGSHIEVQVAGAEMTYQDTPYHRCLGSPAGSIAAAISALALQKPVRITRESETRGTSNIELEVLS